MIPYGRQQITEEDIAAVVEALKSDFLTQGPQVEAFEKLFAETVGAPYALAVANGTVALHLAVLGLDLKAGEKVLCTPNSFLASSNCVLYAGGEVEFVDIDPNTYCLDLNLLEKKLLQNPGVYKGVVAVDFAGFPMVRERLRALANQHKIWIIEDACHAVGGKYKDAKGTWHLVGASQHSDVSVFSFHPVKHVTTCEGGMITTRNRDIYEKMKVLRAHGILRDPKLLTRYDGGWYHEMHELGFNYRLPDVLCALGISQMKRLSTNIERRQQIAKRYIKELMGCPLILPRIDDNELHAFHLFVIRCERRAELYEFLKSHQIYTQVHYIPISTQPYYVKRYGVCPMPQAEAYYSQALSLPMYHSLTDADQTFVIEKIRQFFGR